MSDLRIIRIETEQDAIAAYAEWCEQKGYVYNHPGIVESIDGGWELSNVNGRLAMVADDGSVTA